MDSIVVEITQMHGNTTILSFHIAVKGYRMTDDRHNDITEEFGITDITAV
jgi:hypothetical protein